MPRPLDLLDKDPFFLHQSQETDCGVSRLDRALDRPPILTILDLWTLSFLPFTSTPLGHRGRPPLHLEHTKIQDVSVTATHPIRTGDHKWSQVWLGGIMMPGMSEASVVIVKLFQQSLFPHDDDCEVKHPSIYAKTEATSYMLMRSLQGREIPWSYGFYKFRLYHVSYDEIAYGHVMEYIPAPTFSLLLEQISSTNQLPLGKVEWTSMIDSLARGLYEIHKCGIAHQDLALRNIIVTDPKFSGAVFLDFAFACKVDDDSTKEDAQSILNCFVRFDVQEYEIKEWYETKRAEEWSTLFARVKFWDCRKAGRIGQYPNLVALWDNVPSLPVQDGSNWKPFE